MLSTSQSQYSNREGYQGNQEHRSHPRRCCAIEQEYCDATRSCWRMSPINIALASCLDMDNSIRRPWLSAAIMLVLKPIYNLPRECTYLHGALASSDVVFQPKLPYSRYASALLCSMPLCSPFSTPYDMRMIMRVEEGREAFIVRSCPSWCHLLSALFASFPINYHYWR
jgi:hypothetical protein